MFSIINVTRKIVVTILLSICLLCPISGISLAKGVHATVLLRTSLSDDESRESVIVDGIIDHKCSTGWHTHPGDEYATVLEGTLELRAKGKEIRTVQAGEAYHNPRGLVHETVNVGEGNARLAITFVVDKGKPLSMVVEGLRK